MGKYTYVLIENACRQKICLQENIEICDRNIELKEIRFAKITNLKK